MKTYSVATLFFFAWLLIFSLGMKSGLAQYDSCSYGTVEEERCTIPKCIADCHDKALHSTGRCITIDTCCCVTRDDNDNHSVHP